MRVHDARVAGHDELRIDPARNIAAWLRAGMLMLEAPVELVGTFLPSIGVFRWWWSGKEHQLQLAPARLDEAFAYAQKNELGELLARQHQLDAEDDAVMLCRLAAHFAHATGMVRQEQSDKIAYYAVFAASARPPIVPDRDVVRTIPPPSAPPATTQPVVREPERELVIPVVRVANTLVRRALHDSARRALLIVNVDTSRDKARFFVTLVAATPDDLVAVDTSRELLDAAGAMLASDARTGNARWRKLVVHIDCAGEIAAISRCDVSA